MINDDQIARHVTVEVRGFHGVACRVVGHQMKRGPSEWYDDEIGEWIHDEEPGFVETGRVLVVMVGDDHKHAVDPEDCTEIERESYCGECGQMGCAHDAYPREAAS